MIRSPVALTVMPEVRVLAMKCLSTLNKKGINCAWTPRKIAAGLFWRLPGACKIVAKGE
jgi:hypothetical protein